MLTVKRFLLVLAAGLVLAGAVAYGSPLVGSDAASASDGGPEMRLTIKEGGACDGETCRVELGAAFTLSVEIVAAPPDYITINSFIVYGPDLIYKPTVSARDEFVWTECGPASSPVRDQLEAGPNSVLHGGTSLLLPPYPLRGIGNVIDLSMTCSTGESSTVVELLPHGDPVAGTKGTLFESFDGSTVVPKVSNITVVCGGGQGPTNTPRPPTGTPPPTDTPVPPTPTQVPPTSTPALFGDANCDGIVDAKDASLVLQRDAGLLGALPCDQKVDVNNDGLLNSLDAALILQFAADLIQQLPVGNTD